MTGHANKNSFRNFPADMLLLSGAPTLGIVLLSSWLWSLTEFQVHVALVLSLLLASAGAALILRAKLPLYRAGVYFSFGPTLIPEARRKFYYGGLTLTVVGCVLALMLIPFR